MVSGRPQFVLILGVTDEGAETAIVGAVPWMVVTPLISALISLYLTIS